MRVRSAVLRGAFALVLLGALALGPGLAAARAAPTATPVYDLDSLVFQASEIVEGDIVRAYRLGTRDCLDVKITAAITGAIKPGETIIVLGTENYVKPSPTAPAGEPLAPGDQVLLFLQPAFLLLGYNVPQDVETFAPVPSGIKLIQKDMVYGFRASADGRLYVADLPVAPPPAVAAAPQVAPPPPLQLPAPPAPQPLATVRAAVTTGLIQVAEWREIFRARPSSADIPKLVALLQARAAAEPGDAALRDAIAEAAAARLANFHDNAALADALLANPGQREMLARGFGTPAGREYLLKYIADPNTPRDRRLALGQTVREAGAVYRSTLDYGQDFAVQTTGLADVKNSSYLTRLTLLAVGQAADEEIAVTLLRALQWQATLARAERQEAVLADLADSAEFLRLLQGKEISGRARYEAESLAWQINPALLAQISPKAGPVLSLAQLIAQNGRAQPRTPLALNSTAAPASTQPAAVEIQLDYQLLFGAEAIDQSSVVFQPVTGGKAYVLERRVLPWDRARLTATLLDLRERARPTQGLNEPGDKLRFPGSTRDLVTLPPDTAPGRYRVFYIFLANKKVVSEGNGFEIEL